MRDGLKEREREREREQGREKLFTDLLPTCGQLFGDVCFSCNKPCKGDGESVCRRGMLPYLPSLMDWLLSYLQWLLC